MILTDHPRPVRFSCQLNRPVYSISARRLRHLMAVGLLGGFAFVVVACWVVDKFTL